MVRNNAKALGIMADNNIFVLNAILVFEIQLQTND